MSIQFEQEIEKGTCLGLSYDYERPKFDNSVIRSQYEAASLITRVVDYVDSTNVLLTPATKKIVVEGLLNVRSVLTGDSSPTDITTKTEATPTANGTDEKPVSSDDAPQSTIPKETAQVASGQPNNTNDVDNTVIHHHNISTTSKLDKLVERLENHFRFHIECYEELCGPQLDYLDRIKEHVSRFKSFSDLVAFLINFIEKDTGFFREKDFLFILIVYVLKHSEKYMHLLYFTPLGTKYDIQQGDDDCLKRYDYLMRRIDEATKM